MVSLMKMLHELLILSIISEMMASFFDTFIEIIIHGLEDSISHAGLQVDVSGMVFRI